MSFSFLLPSPERTLCVCPFNCSAVLTDQFVAVPTMASLMHRKTISIESGTFLRHRAPFQLRVFRS